MARTGRITTAVRCVAWRLVALAVLASVHGMAGCASRGEPSPRRPWVREVRIRGNAHVSRNDLLSRIALEPTSWIPFARRRRLDSAALEVDRARIEALYRSRGYFGARVVRVDVDPPRPDPDEAVTVEVVIDEGEPTRITALELRGLEGLDGKSRGRVTEKLPIATGAVMDHGRYLDTRGLIAARLRAEGRAWAEVRGEVRVDRDEHTARVILDATPGPEVRFGAVRVVGEGPSEAIRRRASIRSGARYDPEEIDVTRTRLEATGLFSLVRVTLQRSDDDPAIADVVIDVRPARRNEIRFGVGFALEQNRHMFVLPFAYTRHGFLGGLRSLRISARPGYVAVPTFVSPDRQGPALELDVTLSQPDWLIRNLGSRVSLGYDLGVEYAFNYHGPRAQLGVNYGLLRDRLLFDASYNVLYYNFWDITDARAFDDPLIARRFLGYTDPYRVAYLLGSVALDLRDRPLAAHRGGYGALQVEGGAQLLGSEFGYFKVISEARGYVPLGSRLVAASRVQYGRIYPYGSEASPITRRFYAGGADSHRGFGYNRLAPQVGGQPEAGGGTTPLVPVGGDELFLAQVELRLDVLRIAGAWLGVVGFFDAGDVPGPRGLDFAQLNLATGGGLRYRTPVGAIRVDLGVRLNRLSPTQPDGRQNADPGARFSFHLSIGEAF